ncbi:F-box/LRR-repeat protein 4 isoform X1 [Tanacetum coccineum]
MCCYGDDDDWSSSSVIVAWCSGITDAGMTAIGYALSSLQSLDVSYYRKLTNKGLSAVAEGCHGLKSLHLTSCRFVTDKLLESLSENCHSLQELGLQGCTNITDARLIALVNECNHIKHLDVNKCTNVGGIGISTITEACLTSLRTLKFLDYYKLGDKSMLAVANLCKILETMDWCLNVSDASLNSILSKCASLEVIDIGCCEEVTDAAFESFGNEVPWLSLKVLKVSNCPKITVLEISMLLEACRLLEYLDVRSCPHVTISVIIQNTLIINFIKI